MLTPVYIVSQVFVIITYILLVITYQVKKRKSILIISFISLITQAATFLLLEAYSGLIMCGVAAIRNIIFLIQENKNGGKSEKINKVDVGILIILYAISVASAFITYDGFWSLFSVFATMLYTYSVWQKNTTVYKIFGILVGLLWIIYNIYIFSVFGIVCESILTISAVIGLLNVKKKKTS